MELHVQPRESEVECTGHLGAVVEFATHAGRSPAYWGMRGVKRGGLFDGGAALPFWCHCRFFFFILAFASS